MQETRALCRAVHAPQRLSEATAGRHACDTVRRDLSHDNLVHYATVVREAGCRPGCPALWEQLPDRALQGWPAHTRLESWHAERSQRGRSHELAVYYSSTRVRVAAVCRNCAGMAWCELSQNGNRAGQGQHAKTSPGKSTLTKSLDAHLHP